MANRNELNETKAAVTAAADNAVLALDDIKAAIENKGVEVPDGTHVSEYGGKIGEVYDAGYQKGAEENTGINPEWTDWRYFSFHNSRNDLVEKLKYTDTSNGTDFSYMFYGCSALTTIPEFDTSNGTTFNYMFYKCSALTTVPEIDTSNCRYFRYMFYGCSALTTIPEIDTSNCISFYQMFWNCTSLTTIPKIDMSNGTDFTGTFAGCTVLTDIGLEGTIKTSGLSLSYCPELTHETLMKFINALVDYSGSTTTYKLTLGTTNLAKLTDEEKAIATERGWTLA